MIAEENKELRRLKQEADDSNFNLQASIATTEAEAKYMVEVEVTKKNKELSFKVGCNFL